MPKQLLRARRENRGMTREQRLARIIDIATHHNFPWPGGVPPEDLCIRRVYAGRHQRACGAWSWSLYSPTVPLPNGLGSQHPAAEIARLAPEAATLYRAPWGDYSIDPRH